KTTVLYADLTARNLGRFAVGTPLLVGVRHLSDPTVRVRDADGVMPDGTPYYDFSRLVARGPVASGEAVGPRSLAVFNPKRVQFTSDLVFLGRLNQPPVFTTVPVVQALAGLRYTYAAAAADPDGDRPTFTLRAGPAGMAVDAATGQVTWTPSAGQIGTHAVTLRAEDGRGGPTEQRFVGRAITPPPHPPPVPPPVPVLPA